MPRCRHCDGFGKLQVYRGGRVISVYCDCVAGDKAIKRVGALSCRPKRLSNYPALKDYYKS